MPSVDTAARAAGLVLVLAAGGCSQYLDRTEGVTTSAGDSIYFNRTQQVNVGAVCARYGGGGHRGAASCVVPMARVDSAVAEMLEILQRNEPV